jgi:hypothetical protein
MHAPTRRATIGIVLTAAAFMLMSRHLAAQAPRRSLDLSAGYAYVRDPRLDLNLPAGWSVDAAATVHAWLSAVAEVSGSHTTAPTILGDLAFGLHAFMAGMRASARAGPFTEFGQVLGGVVHASGSAFGTTSSATHGAAQAGAGVDAPVKGRVSFRVQLDFRFVGADEDVRLGREVRGVAAVVYRLF